MKRLLPKGLSRLANGRQQYFRADATSPGFTLVEVIVTMVAAAILIGGVHTAYVAQVSTSAKARDTVIANSYAEGKMESLRSQGFLALTDGTTNLTSTLPQELQSPRSATMVISSQSVSTKRVVLTVTYNDRGTARTSIYTTYIGELGVGQY